MGMPTLQELLTGQLDQVIEQHAAGTNSGATATEAAAVGKKHMITSVEAWSDGAVLLQLKDDATVIKEWKLLADTPFSKDFRQPLEITAGKAFAAVVANSTTDCHVSFSGFTVDEGA